MLKESFFFRWNLFAEVLSPFSFRLVKNTHSVLYSCSDTVCENRPNKIACQLACLLGCFIHLVTVDISLVLCAWLRKPHIMWEAGAVLFLVTAHAGLAVSLSRGSSLIRVTGDGLFYVDFPLLILHCVSACKTDKYMAYGPTYICPRHPAFSQCANFKIFI